MSLWLEEEGTALIGSGRYYDNTAAILGSTVDDSLDSLGLNQGAIRFYAIVGEDVFLAKVSTFTFWALLNQASIFVPSGRQSSVCGFLAFFCFFAALALSGENATRQAISQIYFFYLFVSFFTLLPLKSLFTFLLLKACNTLQHRAGGNLCRSPRSLGQR